MKEKLISLLEAKNSLQVAQQGFRKTLLARYPVLMTQDISELRKEIDGELELLLSSSTRIASVRIVIPYKGGYKEGVVLTRNPGLKQPYESYSAFPLTDIDEIDAKGDLIILDKDNKAVEKKKVNLSILKTSGQIIQDRLTQFYSFLTETIALMKGLNDFVPEHSWSDENRGRVKAGNHRIKLRSHGFDLEIYNEHAKKDYDKFKDIEAEHIVNYEHDSWKEKKGSIDMQDSLMTFVRDFELIDGVLMAQEQRKTELIKKGEDLRSRILDYNKPYKILRKLLVQN